MLRLENAKFVHFLLCLNTDKSNELIDQIEANEIYAARYLNHEDSIRVYSIFKALLLISKYCFQKEKVVMIVKPLLNKLAAAYQNQRDLDTLLALKGQLI